MARDKAYREAEKKIEEVRRSGAKELDLRGMQLTILPESLGTLTQLHSLNLRNNQLTALPEWLGQLTQLQSLDLRDNGLTARTRASASKFQDSMGVAPHYEHDSVEKSRAAPHNDLHSCFSSQNSIT